MFRQYNKPSIKSIQSKKKQQQLQQQQANKKPAPKPEWNTSSGQEDKYKLSQAEVVIILIFTIFKIFQAFY